MLDIDECQQEIDMCDDNANCSDTVGSYVCYCNSGYTGTGLECEGKNT